MEEEPYLFPLFNSFILAQRKGNDKAFPATLNGKTSQSKKFFLIGLFHAPAAS